MTVVRIWRSVTLATKADQYLECLNKGMIPTCQNAEGIQGLFIMRELQGELAHFMLVSLWTSDAALADFTGSDSCEVVKPSPEEKSLLLAFESTASHYSVVYTSKSPLHE